MFSCIQVFATPWTVPHQAPLSMEITREEYWSRLLFPNPGDLPQPGFEPTSLVSLALTGRFFTPSTTWEPIFSLELDKMEILQKRVHNFQQSHGLHWLWNSIGYGISLDIFRSITKAAFTTGSKSGLRRMCTIENSPYYCGNMNCCKLLENFRSHWENVIVSITAGNANLKKNSCRMSLLQKINIFLYVCLLQQAQTGIS